LQFCHNLFLENKFTGVAFPLRYAFGIYFCEKRLRNKRGDKISRTKKEKVKRKSIIIIVVCVAIIAVGVFGYKSIEYHLKKTQMDALYTYFHKIQDSIKAKRYPINMDSLKTVVYKERNTLSIYSKLRILENSVKVYKAN
jgi:predicted negative regulator of RcsB-dependent stress response